MGYLNNSTITVDAILTKKGRELLSKGQSQFNITQYAVADDEVDYSLIKKFGITIGKEKIEKNPTANHACHPRVHPFRSLPGGNLPLLRGSDSSHAAKEIQDACRGLGFRV